MFSLFKKQKRERNIEKIVFYSKSGYVGECQLAKLPYKEDYIKKQAIKIYHDSDPCISRWTALVCRASIQLSKNLSKKEFKGRMKTESFLKMDDLDFLDKERLRQTFKEKDISFIEVV